jgi:UDP-N-acetylglucosamine diphosphorylase/glucosamine-1-phosphate N-acetyltransferase
MSSISSNTASQNNRQKMAIVLFDDTQRHVFLPLVFTKPVGKLRMGIHTMDERWASISGGPVRFQTENYLIPLFESPSGGETFINARLFPTPPMVEAFKNLNEGQAWQYQGQLLMHRSSSEKQIEANEWTGEEPFMIHAITDLFNSNDRALRLDFEQINQGGKHQTESCTIIGPSDQLFVHPSAKVIGAFINTATGPVYIDADAEVMEGSMIRGPFYLGQHAQLKMGAKVYGATTIGPECKFGGEISNCVVQGFSNKAHDGFLGNALIGEWCNLGADTNSSNLKNNYSDVQIYQYGPDNYVNTYLTFCGLIMGDHSKCGINTMFNTGTVVGVGANIFGGDFPEKHIPSFMWGGPNGWQEYHLDKMLETASKVYARRKMTLSQEMVAMLTEVFQRTADYRSNTPQSQ